MAHVSPEVAIAITRQKARYCRYADTMQWDRLGREITLPDARLAYCDAHGKPLQVSGRALVFDSAHSFVTFYDKFFAQLDTMHIVSAPDLERVADDEVKAIFGFEDQVISKYLGSWFECRGGGYYYTTWKLVDEQWYIKDLRMERTYQKLTVLAQIGLALSNWFGISL